jgi:cytochrome b6-f complex iron-sulfur subunit
MLQQVGGSATVTLNGYSDPNCQGGDIIVVQESAGQFVALSAMCPHQWCDVQYNGPGQGFSCPCHGAQFDITGKSAGIRTSRPLAVLTTCADSNGVTVSW